MKPDAETILVVLEGHEFARDRLVAVQSTSPDDPTLLRVRYIETGVECLMRTIGLRAATEWEIRLARAAAGAVERVTERERADAQHEAERLRGEIDKVTGWYREATEKLDVPVPMRLLCPRCGRLHIDEGEFATKPHHAHACQNCGEVWRPAVVATVGVQFLPGFKNEVAP